MAAEHLLCGSILLFGVSLNLHPLLALCNDFNVLIAHMTRQVRCQRQGLGAKRQALLPGNVGVSSVPLKARSILVRVLLKLTPLSGLGNDGYVL